MAISKTIVFIHGLHENSNCWNEWVIFFEKLGYDCHAPNYPFHEGLPSELRLEYNKGLERIRLNDVVSHYLKYIGESKILDPILIGHSMGGLIVQKLIQEKIGSLGICITTASPKGVITFKWSFVKSNLRVINPLMGSKLYCGSREWFHYAICNSLSRQQSDEIYDKAVVPESRNIPRSSRLSDGKIDFSKPHVPLLFIGADNDHIIPIELVLKNFAAYKNSQSIKELKEFKGRSHSICVQSGWQEVAIFIEEWIIKMKKMQGDPSSL